MTQLSSHAGFWVVASLWCISVTSWLAFLYLAISSSNSLFLLFQCDFCTLSWHYEFIFGFSFLCWPFLFGPTRHNSRHWCHQRFSITGRPNEWTVHIISWCQMSELIFRPPTVSTLSLRFDIMQLVIEFQQVTFQGEKREKKTWAIRRIKTGQEKFKNRKCVKN